MKLEQEKSFIRNVTILPQYYVVFAFTDDCLEGVERCCVNSSSIFRCDATVEIMDKLWLTNTSYTNTALLKTQDTKHLEFPGPMMVHFTKGKRTYRRLATEIVTAKPNLSNISMIVDDMDQAIKHGLTSIFSKAESLVYLQHVSERDNKKLDKLVASTLDKKRILGDIYGNQKNGFLQFGLTDPIDVFDFNVKLESLKSLWDSLVPGFHSWFVRKRAPIFQNQNVGEALDRLQLDTRFTNNHLEVMHKIQKKNATEANSVLEVTSVLKTLHKWHLLFRRETEKAFYGQGKFRLAPGYEQFYR